MVEETTDDAGALIVVGDRTTADLEVDPEEDVDE